MSFEVSNFELVVSWSFFFIQHILQDLYVNCSRLFFLSHKQNALSFCCSWS